jgi:putative phosphoribosyl transferase
LGRALAARHWSDPVVLALPRGGVPVAVEVAAALRAPLDLLFVQKIGAPQQRELAIAALAEGPPETLVIDDETFALTGASRAYVEREAALARAEIARRRSHYLGSRAPVPVAGCTAIVVDDGIATGTSVRAALRALRARRPERLVLAVPLAPARALAALTPEVDDLVCLETPQPFHAVGAHYALFAQVSDDEVIAALTPGPATTKNNVPPPLEPRCRDSPPPCPPSVDTS